MNNKDYSNEEINKALAEEIKSLLIEEKEKLLQRALKKLRDNRRQDEPQL